MRISVPTIATKTSKGIRARIRQLRQVEEYYDKDRQIDRKKENIQEEEDHEKVKRQGK